MPVHCPSYLRLVDFQWEQSLRGVHVYWCKSPVMIRSSSGCMCPPAMNWPTRRCGGKRCCKERRSQRTFSASQLRKKRSLSIFRLVQLLICWGWFSLIYYGIFYGASSSLFVGLFFFLLFVISLHTDSFWVYHPWSKFIRFWGLNFWVLLLSCGFRVCSCPGFSGSMQGGWETTPFTSGTENTAILHHHTSSSCHAAQLPSLWSAVLPTGKKKFHLYVLTSPFPASLFTSTFITGCSQNLKKN